MADCITFFTCCRYSPVFSGSSYTPSNPNAMLVAPCASRSVEKKLGRCRSAGATIGDSFTSASAWSMGFRG